MDPITAISQVTSAIGSVRSLVDSLRGGGAKSSSETEEASFEDQLNAFVTRLMVEKDGDADGALSAKEFGKDQALFKAMDINGDGKLNRQELVKGYTAVSTASKNG